jgi:hypothetical protein
MEMFKVPRMRVIHHKSKEYKEMQFALDKISNQDETLRRQVRGQMNRPFITLMEYIPGFDASNIFNERAHQIYHP